MKKDTCGDVHRCDEAQPQQQSKSKKSPVASPANVPDFNRREDSSTPKRKAPGPSSNQSRNGSDPGNTAAASSTPPTNPTLTKPKTKS